MTEETTTPEITPETTQETTPEVAPEVAPETTQEVAAQDTAATEAATEAAVAAATATSEAMANAIVEGLKNANQKNFELNMEEGIDHRFSVVADKSTGEVFVRENETGKLSALQRESLEEKEADLQHREVEEV